jgi:hypothetical protein
MARALRTVSQTSRKEPTLSFFDEGDEPPTAVRSPRPQPRRPARGRRSSADDRTLLVRRGVAAAVILALLIAIILVIKSVLDNQALSGLKTYNANVTSVARDERSSVRDQVFRTIDNALNSSSSIDVQASLQQYLSQEQSYYREVQGWSVPAQMVGAQRYYVEVLGLRSEALTGIETEMQTALAPSSGQGLAIKLIAGDMEKLLASDVLYADRVAPLINQALAKAGIAETAPASPFLPDITWLAPATVAARILGYVPASLGGSKPAAGQLVGHALESVGIRQANGTISPLKASGVNTIPYASAGVNFVLTFTNGGTVNEYGVETKIDFYKAGLSTSCLTGTAEVIKTVPGGTYTPSILFDGGQCTNVSDYLNQVLQMTAEVAPVPGETDTKNNSLPFDVEFTH